MLTYDLIPQRGGKLLEGRVLILNRAGIPIANVLIPGRDEGKHLRSPNVAFKPGTDQVFLTVSGEVGAWIYQFRGLAKGLRLRAPMSIFSKK